MTSPTTPPTKPVSGKTSRSTSSAASRRASDPDARFTRNVTIAFVAIIVAVAVVVLIGLAYGFWESNLKPLANVNGTEIGRGEWEDRQRLEAFRADRTETATRAALLAGEIDEDLANTRLTAATNARNAGAGRGHGDPGRPASQEAAGRGAGRHAVRGGAGSRPGGRRHPPGGAPHRGPRRPAPRLRHRPGHRGGHCSRARQGGRGAGRPEVGHPHRRPRRRVLAGHGCPGRRHRLPHPRRPACHRPDLGRVALRAGRGRHHGGRRLATRLPHRRRLRHRPGDARTRGSWTP